MFSFKVEFERVRTKDDSSDLSRTVKRVLFGRMQFYPQKKVMTFNKHVKDFTFEVNYGDLSFLTEAELQYVCYLFLVYVRTIFIQDLEYTVHLYGTHFCANLLSAEAHLPSDAMRDALIHYIGTCCVVLQVNSLLTRDCRFAS